MVKRDEASRVILHPPEVRGGLGWYCKGCHCDDCRAANAATARARRKRLATGTTSPHQLTPNDAARAAVIKMRKAGMVWDGMAMLVGTDRRDLQRILNSPGGQVKYRTERLVLAAAQRLDADPGLALRGKRTANEGVRVRWMLGCLLARGWDSLWIAEQIGWNWRITTTNIASDTVNVRTWARLEGVFKTYHTEWGQSRMTAVRAWRAGKFLSDCYDWEGDEPDYRPVPGSLHPDLVEEACTYKQSFRHRGPQMRSEFHSRWGQWENQRCAAAALRNWQLYMGEPVEPASLSEVCGMVAHKHHILPTRWTESPES